MLARDELAFHDHLRDRCGVSALLRRLCASWTLRWERGTTGEGRRASNVEAPSGSIAVKTWNSHNPRKSDELADDVDNREASILPPAVDVQHDPWHFPPHEAFALGREGSLKRREPELLPSCSRAAPYTPAPIL
jgi:hypothetical protein